MTVNSHERFITLDVFRGMTVFFMIVANTQGIGAVPFKQLEVISSLYLAKTHYSFTYCLTCLVYS